MKPKICVLFCGGTIAMKKDTSGSLDVAEGVVEELMNLEPRLKENFDMEVIFIDNIDSTNMTPSHWDKLANTIYNNYEKYDGFVITHGTNTLGYTSSALSFALLGIGKPVVLTGAQIPLSELESDARRNFVNAVKVASMDISGVVVVFGSKVILGTRAKKNSESDIDAFKTFNGEDIGEIGISLKLKGNYTKRHNKKFTLQSGFDPKILILTLEPGISPQQLEMVVDSGIEGLIVRAYGAGDVPTNLLPALEKARKKKIPVVITTQCPNGVTHMDLNTAGYRAVKTGVIEAFDMNMESMTTKLRWLLSQKIQYEKIKEMMQKNLSGEVAPRSE